METNKICGIYIICHIPTGRAYIGSSINVGARLKMHFSDLRRKKHHSPHLQRVFDRHPVESFTWAILETCEPLELRSIEIKWLLEMQPFFNCMRAVNPSLITHSEKTREKLRAAHAEILATCGYPKHDEQWNERIAISHIGMKASDVARAKMSVSAKKRGMAHLHSAEARAKSGDSQRGIPKSQSHREALSAAHKGYDMPESQKQKISDALKLAYANGTRQPRKSHANITDGHRFPFGFDERLVTESVSIQLHGHGKSVQRPFADHVRPADLEAQENKLRSQIAEITAVK